jgi:hypothetical protein
MSKLRFVGLDVHADTIAVAVAEESGERVLSRIYVVALRASLTEPVLHQNCSAHQSERKNILAPQQSRGA